MPGRQSHGRQLMLKAPSEKTKSLKQSNKKTKSNYLNAFAIAAEQEPVSKKGARAQKLHYEDSDRRPKRPRVQDEGDEDSDDDENSGHAEPRAQKRARKNDDEFGGFSGSDSDGNEWHEGVDSEDDDSDIDSDTAFGESDEERFEGFAFRGSKSRDRAGGSDDDDDESLGSDAIDLATALDQFSEEDSGEEDDSESGSDSEDGSSSSESDTDDEDGVNPSDLKTLQSLISGFGGNKDDDEAALPASDSKPKLSLEDLGLDVLKDAHMKKSLKLMQKEEKSSKPGAAKSKKLEVPLPRRQQDRLLRSAAYQKASEQLDRWTETVKQNRRAEHLVFPLAQNAHDSGLYNEELTPLTQKNSGTELESTVLAIMEESGLGPSSKAKDEHAGEDGQGQAMSKEETKELQRQRRLARQQHDKEQIRAKRIKKIKSKAWRRVHRKERLRDEELEEEERREAGEIDSDDEREANDMRRAMERMGARHRESKWAKLGKKAGRAVWDDEFRSNLAGMALKRDELRRRVEGRADGSDEDGAQESESDDGEEDLDDRRRLLHQLDKAAAYDDDDEPVSGLMEMKFMQKAEAARKKENDEMVRQLRRELDSDQDDEDSEVADIDIGRRQFGTTNTGKIMNAIKASKIAQEQPGEGLASAQLTSRKPEKGQVLPATDLNLESSAPGEAGAWSKVEKASSKSKKGGQTKFQDLDVSSAPATKYAGPRKAAAAQGDDDDSEFEDAQHLPLAVKDQELLKRAFAGADVVQEFEQEKKAAEESEGEKEVDNTLPGWGSWVGEGISKREQKRHKGRFITKVEGVKKADRKDAKLKKVIVSEKRVKKNDAYLASQLPHPFESRQQYERSLRLPIGPEWMTKETFQDSTKPRVIVKQGIIAPMSKPMY